jgi:diguanylate cyclase (GGDEF)-like protein/PAS domain S-box-containing protein
MSFQFHPYAVLLAVSALTTLIASIIILRRAVPGSTALGGMLVASFIWSSAYGMMWSLVELDAKLTWLKIAYLGVVSVPTLFLLFVLRITHNDEWLSRRNLAVVCIEPTLILLVVWFRLDWMFSEVYLQQHAGFSVLHLGRSDGFWLNTIYSYGLLMLALSVLGISALRANPLFSRQYLVIMVACVIPFAASVFTQVSYSELADLDMAPISLGVSGVLFVYALFRYQFMDLLPVARGRLIESMSDGVLVVDDRGRIVDVNPAVQGFIASAPVTLVGRNISEVLKEWAYNVDLLLSGLETRTEVRSPLKPTRYLDLRVTPLYDERNNLTGRLIVFRDVTDRKEVEQNLRRAMDRLQTQLIEIGTLQSQLREQAIRDALTGVFNRRYLEETLARELARAKRETYPLSVVMMDLDFFKEINDTYGHEAGDVVLKTLAETVVRQSRHGDFVCRYGGEEFVLVMPNIGIETARERAEELHQIVNGLNIPYGVFNLTTTISMGVAMYPDHGATKEEIMRAADRAMYVAKNTGRNRVVVASEQMFSVE